MSKILIYGDVNLNIIDGSSVWVASICEVLSDVFDEVLLQVKTPVTNDRLLQRLETIGNISILDVPSVYLENRGEIAPELSSDEAIEVLKSVYHKELPDALLVRGFEVCFKAARVQQLASILWAYITDMPYPITKISKTNKARLKTIGQRAKKMFAQTEAARSYLEQVCPESAGKTSLMPPMIPNDAFLAGRTDSPDDGSIIRIIYAGKLAKDWCVESMLDLPEELARRGIRSELVVIGDKFQKAPGDAQFVNRLREKLLFLDSDPASSVEWLGGLPRSEVFSHLSTSHFGVGWRTSALDCSTEISTKFLEYSAAGVVPIANSTEDHKDLLGNEYPFFVESDSSISDIADCISLSLHRYLEARGMASTMADSFSMRSAKKRLRRIFRRSGVLPVSASSRASGSSRNLKLVIASHDFKFMGELMEFLQRDPNIELKIDRWSSLHEHDEDESRRLARWADVIFCEWAGPSVRWFAENKPTGTKLITRLHRFELKAPWMEDTDFDKVDRVVFVSEFFREKSISSLRLDRSKTCVISNVIDWDDFDRPKIPGSEFRLGVIGIVGFWKRPDRSLDVLEQLVAIDDRYSLHIKGQNPWNYPYHWADPVQKQSYLEFYARIAKSEVLRDRVSFDGFSPAVGAWFRKIGFILSPSHDESFHLAVAEGMASSCVPVVWRREGSPEIFSEQFIVNDAVDARDRILSLNADGVTADVGNRAREYSRRWDYPEIFDRWKELFVAI